MSRDLGFLQARQGNQIMLHILQMLQANYKEKIHYFGMWMTEVFLDMLYEIVSFFHKHRTNISLDRISALPMIS